jgi:hypothetical protein
MDTNNSPAVVDLSAAMPLDTFDLEIRAPGGVRGTGWIWTLCAPSHPKAVARAEAKQRENLRRAAQIEQQQANGKKVKVDEQTVEEVRRDNAEWIASRTLRFTPVRIASIQPDPIEWSDEKVVELMRRPDMGWVFVQIVEYLNSETAFTPRSATS